MFEYIYLSGLCCHIAVLFVLMSTINESVEGQQLRSPAVDFKHHTVVQPIVQHGKSKREIRTTRDMAGDHHKEVTVIVNVDGEDYMLDLLLNEELVARDYVISYQKDGGTVLQKPKKEEFDICQYVGTVRGKSGSWVAVSTCHGVAGVIHDGRSTKYIEPAGNAIDSQHFIYDHSDLNKNYPFRCGYSDGVVNNTEYGQLLLNQRVTEERRTRSRISRYKREAYDTVHEPYGSNKQSRYVELVLVVDNRQFRANGESIDTVQHQLRDLANIINSMFAALNIFIALVGVVIWSERDEIRLEKDSAKTLDNFLQYRRVTLLRDIPNDNAHLLTSQIFNDHVVGKAYKGAICSYKQSGAVASNHSDVIGLVAVTMAHEMGHNFNMEHDTKDCECPDESCIMSDSSGVFIPSLWSSCSLRSLSLAFERGLDYCLRNKPKRLFNAATCGNGFVEAGEQCDCGLTTVDSSCTACCDPRTCTLRSNATCAVGGCCDHTTCRPKSAGTVCRSADRACDLPEYCTGDSQYCPMDVHKMDTTPCGKGKAYCVRGECRSHSDQCRLLWGPVSRNSHESCYASNVNGNAYGNCGYKHNDNEKEYNQCRPEDVMCGLLKCWSVNEFTEFGKVMTTSTQLTTNNGTLFHCKSAVVDLGISDVDPGLVPDGAKCGENKMCLNQRCVSVELVRKHIVRTKPSVCPSDCSGHGVCNSNGHCHCEDGFDPPLCNIPGPGGSYDSGPATDPSIQRKFMVAMYVIFLGILPFALIIVFLVYYSRCNALKWWQNRKKICTLNITQCIQLPQTNFSFRKGPKSKAEVKYRTEENNSDLCTQENINVLNNQQPSQSLLQKYMIHTENTSKFPVKSFRKKINIDDIKVFVNGNELTEKVLVRNSSELKMLHCNNSSIKPVKQENSKPVIINNRLSSEYKNIGTPDKEPNDKATLNNSKRLYNFTKEPVSSQPGSIANITQVNKKVSNTDNIIIKKPKGLSSTNKDTRTIAFPKNTTIAQVNSPTAVNTSTEAVLKLKNNKSRVNNLNISASNLPSTSGQRINNRSKEENNNNKSTESPKKSQVKDLLRKFEKNATLDKDISM